MHPGCRGSLFECYFSPITECQLSGNDIDSAQTHQGIALDKYPVKYERVIKLRGVTSDGVCSVCGSSWDGSTAIFEGIHIGELGFITKANADGTLDPTLFNAIDPEYNSMGHMNTLMSKTKIFWLSQFLRYIFKPRQWFDEYLSDITKVTLSDYVIPHPFSSLHVRHGEKIIETKKYINLHTYMKTIKIKAPYIRNIFVSTETFQVISNLTR
jgi:hypothetical protein